MGPTDCRRYTAFCLKKLAEIQILEPDSDWQEGKELLASKHKGYNIFSYSEFYYLKKYITRALPQKYRSKGYGLKGWVNWLDPFQELPTHSHHYDLSGHVTLQAESGSTFYTTDDIEYEVKPKLGMLHLLEQGVPHRVGENLSSDARVSIAFDLIRYNQIEKELHPLLERV